jgi:hypothetical protein
VRKSRSLTENGTIVSINANGRAEARPGWPAVEQLLAELTSSGTSFPTVLSSHNRITSHDSRRLSLESDHGMQWIELASIRSCWETFERLGRVTRRDLLEPGRCSAFMIALFSQVPEVTEHVDDEHYLLLPGARDGPRAT